MRKLFRLILVIVSLVFIFKYQKEIINIFYYLNSNFLRNTNSHEPKIIINNLINLSREQIIIKINKEINNKNIIIDLKKLEKKIKEIKEIKSVKIKRDFNGNLNIKIFEKKPFMFWKKKNQSIIDINGDPLNFKKDLYLKLPVLLGEEANKNIKQIYNKISKYNAIKNNLVSAEYINKYRWNLVLFKDIKVLLSYDNIDDNLHILDKLIRTNFFQKKNYKTADFRIEEKVFFK